MTFSTHNMLAVVSSWSPANPNGVSMTCARDVRTDHRLTTRTIILVARFLWWSVLHRPMANFRHGYTAYAVGPIWHRFVRSFGCLLLKLRFDAKSTCICLQRLHDTRKTDKLSRNKSKSKGWYQCCSRPPSLSLQHTAQQHFIRDAIYRRTSVSCLSFEHGYWMQYTKKERIKAHLSFWMHTKHFLSRHFLYAWWHQLP